LSKAVFTFFIIICFTHASAAALNIQQQRSLYLKAQQAFADKNNQLANQLTAELTSYPLYPYLKLLQIQRDINSTSQQQIHSLSSNIKTLQ